MILSKIPSGKRSRTYDFLRKIIMKLSGISALVLFAACALYAETSDPVELIKTKNRELQTLLSRKGKTSTKNNRDKIKKLISEMFDFQEMGRKSLSKSTYDSLPEEKRREFVKAFQEMIENRSIKKLELYKSDSTTYDEPLYKKKGKEVHVTAHSFYKGQESIVLYKMFLKDGKWRGWDLVIDDLHTTRNYKTRFRSILKKKSFDELIQLLKDKAQETEEEAEKPLPPEKKKSK
jgi:phospholipid transport system substrate-binding protein